MRTSRTTVRRLPDRAAYDRPTVEAILDQAPTCHIGFVADGQPFVIPTIHGRIGDQLYVHGSGASRMLRMLRNAIPICVTVTIVDGLVLARSAFHHSMNYRSVVVLGHATDVRDRCERLDALRAISNRLVPGRWEIVRLPSDQELRQTKILRIPLVEASAKIRSGNPSDDESDLVSPVWAGVLPIHLAAGKPIPADGLPEGFPVPDHVRWHRLMPRQRPRA